MGSGPWSNACPSQVRSLRDGCSDRDAMSIRLVEGVQRAGVRPSAVSGRDVPGKRMTIEAMTAARTTVSINKACELLDVSRRTIYNWIASGKVEYVRTAGGSVRIFADTLWRAPDDTVVSRSDSRGVRAPGSQPTRTSQLPGGPA